MLSLFMKKNEDTAKKSANQAYQAQPQTAEAVKVEIEREENPPKNIIHDIPIDNIVPNPNQPRKEFDERGLYSLAQSMRDYGIIQPLSVRLIEREGEEDNGDKKYELIAGERRLRAAKLLCMENVPCVIIEADSRFSAEIAIIENLQREDLNFFEQARAIHKLIESFGYTQEQTAKRLAVSQSYVANKLRILKLSKEEQEVIIEYGLTERHARSFIRIADTKERCEVIAAVIKRSMNVAATDKYIDRLLEKNDAKNAKGRTIFIIKDIRLFLNTIDKAVDTVVQSGVDIKSEKTDKGDYIEICLTVPKRKA